MKKSISPNDCRHMFDDKISSLSMRELGIELKHFSIGTAPECPSYLVNQDSLKRTLIEKFSNFFDVTRSQGLEVVFLKSNYGNGKSHFIRTIYSFLSNYENVYTKKVSLKQEATDLKNKVLEGIGQKVLKDAAMHFVDCAVELIQTDTKEPVLQSLTETLNIDLILAELLYNAARSNDIAIQSKATAILKANYLPEYLKTFSLKPASLNSEFYMNVIRLICNYLSENDSYMVIVFDEYEHVYSWKDIKARKSFFSDIKLFLDDIETYKNLFFVFAESESMGNSTEASDDPAYVSRKKGQTYQIEDISSEIEIRRLYEMIRARYEKYYEVQLTQYDDDIFRAIINDEQVKSNTNYRSYTQAIMRVLDLYRTNRKMRKKSSTGGSCINENVIGNKGLSFEQKWQAATSMSKKTYLCDALEHILLQSDETLNSKTKSRRRGFYQTRYEEEINNYHIIYTDNPTLSDFLKRYKEATKIQEESAATKMIMLYPAHQSLSDLVYENVFFYDVNKVPSVIAQVEANLSHIENVLSYLDIFK